MRKFLARLLKMSRPIIVENYGSYMDPPIDQRQIHSQLYQLSQERAWPLLKSRIVKRTMRALRDLPESGNQVGDGRYHLGILKGLELAFDALESCEIKIAPEEKDENGD